MPFVPDEYLSEIVNLSIEPQFVRGKFGCTEFLTWVISVMKTCGNHLTYQEGVIHSWVLRFYRLLLRLENMKLTTLPNFIAKHSKAYAKELLKLPKYRDCLQLYIEYALVGLYSYFLTYKVSTDLELVWNFKYFVLKQNFLTLFYVMLIVFIKIKNK